MGIRSTGNGYSGDSFRQKFDGYERDSETGLDYAINRYHASVQGRFTSPDPLYLELRVDTRWERLEERKGFNAGLIAGRRDALSHRRFNPVILQRRFVSNDYREGFRKGYAQAYYQFSKNRGHHYGRGY